MVKSDRKLLNREKIELEASRNMMDSLNLRENIKLKNKRDKSVKTKFLRSKRKD